MTVVINGTTGIDTPGLDADPGAVLAQTLTVNNNNISAVNSLGFRNRIINGGMVIDQRNNGAAVTAEGYLVDRWRVWRDQTYSIQQSTDAPSGFATSLAVTKTNTTQSIYAYLTQYIEGFNFADMLFGTANAKTITLSFWVKSSVTGTFSAGLVNSAETRAYSATYTVSAANTWEQKTITIAGDASGTWIGSTNGKGCGVWFNFGSAGGGGTNTANAWVAGSVNPASGGTANLGTTNGATFYITGVQLEAGTVATPFERRDYGRELQMCQRYYEVGYIGVRGATSAAILTTMPYAVVKRATPTVAITVISGTSVTAGNGTNATTQSFYITGTSGGTGFLEANWNAPSEL